MELNKNVLEYSAEELREIADAKELGEKLYNLSKNLYDVFNNVIMEVQENDPDLLQELINEMED